jgi:hypothetical protein
VYESGFGGGGGKFYPYLDAKRSLPFHLFQNRSGNFSQARG